MNPTPASRPFQRTAPITPTAVRSAQPAWLTPAPSVPPLPRTRQSVPWQSHQLREFGRPTQ